MRIVNRVLIPHSVIKRAIRLTISGAGYNVHHDGKYLGSRRCAVVCLESQHRRPVFQVRIGQLCRAIMDSAVQDRGPQWRGLLCIRRYCDSVLFNQYGDLSYFYRFSRGLNRSIKPEHLLVDPSSMSTVLQACIVFSLSMTPCSRTF